MHSCGSVCQVDDFLSSALPGWLISMDSGSPHTPASRASAGMARHALRGIAARDAGALAWRHTALEEMAVFSPLRKSSFAGHAGDDACDLLQAEAQRLKILLPGPRTGGHSAGVDRDDAAQLRSRSPCARLGGGRAGAAVSLAPAREKRTRYPAARARGSSAASARARLVVIGGGDAGYVAEVRALARELEARLPRIDWLGEIWGDARWPYFQGADLFCLPSHSENFGLAVLEACQVGTGARTTHATPWGEGLAGERGYVGDATVESIARQSLERFFPRSTADHGTTRTNSPPGRRQSFRGMYWLRVTPPFIEQLKPYDENAAAVFVVIPGKRAMAISSSFPAPLPNHRLAPSPAPTQISAPCPMKKTRRQSANNNSKSRSAPSDRDRKCSATSAWNENSGAAAWAWSGSRTTN